MPNLMLVLEYEGARYHGFQKQAGVPTIQGELERAVKRLTGLTVRTVGASRTDAGAHALWQVASFHTAASLPASTWMKALNFYLPEDIVVKEAGEVDEAFHARRSASSREYHYRVWNRAAPSPFWRRYAYHFPYAMDLEAMREASASLIGTHDFSSFASVKGVKGGSAMRRLMEASLDRDQDVVRFRFVGNAFLPQQVRTMVGTLLDVGSGRTGASEMARLLQSGDRTQAGPTVPACGLCLVKVNY
ncbi:MAG TPA: tRNA pseudouridine(38-40) synthase TruA [Dehalococcoidia bacterium]|nr:tRNA pseudouridine(38-40) synthase TruA [Dehalococcoidia bacterium]